MAFIDPFELLRIKAADADQGGAEIIRKSKRRLLNEFELGDGISIPFRDGFLDKAQVLAVVEPLEDPEVLRNWLDLHQRPELLILLRNHQYSQLEKLSQQGPSPLPAFQSGLLSKYFEEVVPEAIRNGDWEVVHAIAKHANLLRFEDQYASFHGIRKDLRATIARIMELKDTKDASTPFVDDPGIYSADRIELYNSGGFIHENAREDYAGALIEYAVLVEGTWSKTEVARNALHAALRLNISAHSREVVKYYLHKLNERHANRKPKNYHYPILNNKYVTYFFILVSGVIFIWFLIVGIPKIAEKEREKARQEQEVLEYLQHPEWHPQPESPNSNHHVLFDILKLQHPMVPDTFQPENGAMVYAGWISDTYSTEDTLHINFINKGRLDAVVWLQSMDGIYLQHAYVRAGHQVLFGRLSDEAQMINIYRGSAWAEDVLENRAASDGNKRKFGAFQSDILVDLLPSDGRAAAVRPGRFHSVELDSAGVLSMF